MNTLVIGGGMAGLTYAITALKNGEKITVVERNGRVGKKISMTGNGKCNIGNANVTESCFNSSAVVNAVLTKISIDEYKTFLKSVGIYTYQDDMGRLYPLSDSASNVVDCLRHQFAQNGGILLLDTNAQSIAKRGDKFLFEGKLYDKVVLACGSGSAVMAPDFTNLVDKNWLTPLCPSLVPVRIKNMDGTLNGIRAKSNVTLIADGKPIATEGGEVLFKDYGISGICVFNLSAIIARNNVKNIKHNYIFSVDLVPYLSYEQLQEIVVARAKYGQMDKLFYGILHNKIAESISKRSKNVREQIQNAKNFTFTLDKLLDYSMSQVTSGGIDDKFVDIKSLTLPNGVVVLGEMLDVDGICGGNNLYFASASALYTFTKQQRENSYKL